MLRPWLASCLQSSASLCPLFLFFFLFFSLSHTHALSLSSCLHFLFLSHTLIYCYFLGWERREQNCMYSNKSSKYHERHCFLTLLEKKPAIKAYSRFCFWMYNSIKQAEGEKEAVVRAGREQVSGGVPQVRGRRPLQTSAGQHRASRSRHHTRPWQPEPVCHYVSL